MMDAKKEWVQPPGGPIPTHASIHGSKRRVYCSARELPRQVFTSVNYPRRLGELYCAAKFISQDGLTRGYSSGDVLEAVTTWTFCSRNGLDVLDAWQAVMDAHRAALVEARA